MASWKDDPIFRRQPVEAEELERRDQKAKAAARVAVAKAKQVFEDFQRRIIAGGNLAGIPSIGWNSNGTQYTLEYNGRQLLVSISADARGVTIITPKEKIDLTYDHRTENFVHPGRNEYLVLDELYGELALKLVKD